MAIRGQAVALANARNGPCQDAGFHRTALAASCRENGGAGRMALAHLPQDFDHARGERHDVNVQRLGAGGGYRPGARLRSPVPLCAGHFRATGEGQKQELERQSGRG